MDSRNSWRGAPIALGLCLMVAGCSIKTLVLNKAASALGGSGGSVFSGDDDPELIAAALPFALKMYESLLEAVPDNDDLLLGTGKAFVMYAYAFVQFPADTLPDTKIAEKTARYGRAKKLYLRGREYLFRALDIRHPGFVASLRKGDADSTVARAGLDDVALLYWTGAAWMAAFTTDKFDMALAVSVPKAVALVRRSLELDDTFGRGAAHEFFVSYYGSMPPSMGGSEERAREHFARALEIADSTKAGPYLSLASSVCVTRQDTAEFRSLLAKALAIDLDADPDNRLANILSQRKARWLLDHVDSFFLLDEVDEQEGEEDE